MNALKTILLLIFALDILITESKPKNVALNKRLYASKGARNKMRRSRVDADDLSCTLARGGPMKTWFVVDLAEEYRIGSVNLKIGINQGKSEKGAPEMSVKILGLNSFQIKKVPPDPLDEDVCVSATFASSIKPVWGKFNCTRTPLTPPWRYLSLIAPKGSELDLCIFEAYPVEEPNEDYVMGFQNNKILDTETELSCRLECVKKASTWHRFESNKCECLSRFKMNLVCPFGLYGQYCGKACHCEDGLPCDVRTGRCPGRCQESYSGPRCDKVDSTVYKVNCQSGFDGDEETRERCRFKCLREAKDVFYFKDKQCECSSKRFVCNKRQKQEQYTVCPRGYYGYECTKVCNCLKYNGKMMDCDISTGKCRQKGCDPGWSGNTCVLKELSYKKKTYQSSTVSQFSASNAVDDNPISASLTLPGPKPSWFVVDLEAAYYIHRVLITAVIQTRQKTFLEKTQLRILTLNGFDKNLNPPNVLFHDTCANSVYWRNGKLRTIRVTCFERVNTPPYRYVALITPAWHSLYVHNVAVTAYQEGENSRSILFLGHQEVKNLVLKPRVGSKLECADACRESLVTFYSFEEDVCRCFSNVVIVSTVDFQARLNLCPIGLYGSYCDRECHCRDNQSCDMDSGKCPNGCHDSYYGPNCDQVSLEELNLSCLKVIIRPDLLNGCRNYCYLQNNKYFFMEKEECLCENENSCGINKYSVCPILFHGYRCSMAQAPCDCVKEYGRGKVIEDRNILPLSSLYSNLCGKGGRCQSICQACKSCPIGFHGQYCERACHCKDKMPCDISGKCPNGCDESFSGPQCNRIDPIKLGLGPKVKNEDDEMGCRDICYHQSRDLFSILDSKCICTDITKAPTAPKTEKYTVCPRGSYGRQCSSECHCKDKSPCSVGGGRCLGGCAKDWHSDACNEYGDFFDYKQY